MWKHGEAGRLVTLNSVYTDDCIYCQASMLRLPANEFNMDRKAVFIQLALCPLCGWWSVYRIHQGELPRSAGMIESHSGSIGCLKEFDLNDISLPLEEVRRYLLAKKDSIFTIHPKLFEDIVCSVFKDCGWHARVTAYAGDDGVDIILDDSSGETIGVQVKRYKKERRIEAEQIRSLAGALLVGGHAKGVFITTSTFRKGARRASEELTSIGYPIELMDVERFFSALGIAQIRSLEFDEDRMVSYALSTGIHLGSGVSSDFVPGEDLRKRVIIASLSFRDELIDLYDETT